MLNTAYTVIVSAYLPSLCMFANEERNEDLFHFIHKNVTDKITRAEGYYMGHKEQSMIVDCKDFYQVMKITTEALETFNQECVLVIDYANSKVMLVYKRDVKLIGTKLIKISLADSLDCNSYTIVNGNYYKVV